MDENDLQKFLEHYGVKGMKKPVSPTKLDRVYRVASGTAILRERMKKNKAIALKKIKADAAASKKADADAKKEAAKNETPADGEAIAKKLVGKHGTTKMTDIGN